MSVASGRQIAQDVQILIVIRDEGSSGGRGDADGGGGSPVPGVTQIAEARCGSQRACLAFDWEHVGVGGEAAPRRWWFEIESVPADTAKAGVGPRWARAGDFR